MTTGHSIQRAEDSRGSLRQPERLRIAAIGGGTGLPHVLRGLCSLLFPGVPRGHDECSPDRLVAIVTTTDDGGSSGWLRREFGGIPPGDIRNCLAAVADRSLITELPGSLYTSVLPPLLIPKLRDALQRSHALKVFVLNLMTEPGKTAGFDAMRHLEVVRAHVELPCDYVIFNTAPVPAHLAETYAAAGSDPITVTTRDIAAMREMQIQPIGAPLASEGPLGRIRHHPARLSATIAACARFDGRRGSRPNEDNHVRTLL